MIEKAQVLEALRGVQDPELGKSLVELGMVHDVEVGDARVHFTLALTTLACPLKERITTPGRRSWRWTECGTCRSICAR
jgi:ATP-binding protein involved in chromosome partitioning